MRHFVELTLGQSELVDKTTIIENGIVLADPVFQQFGKQRALPTSRHTASQKRLCELAADVLHCIHETRPVFEFTAQSVAPRL